MRINFDAKVIEMSKKFAKAAAVFGSEAYGQLQEARHDYPDFRVLTVSRKACSSREYFKGLTYSYMEKYIAEHDDDQKSIMAEYKMLRGLSEEACEALAESCSYNAVRSWFLRKYPAIAGFRQKREELLAV